jgi:hypothetical protein
VVVLFDGEFGGVAAIFIFGVVIGFKLKDEILTRLGDE